MFLRTLKEGEKLSVIPTPETPPIRPGTKLIRITTVPLSLHVLLKHQLRYMSGYFNILAISSSGKLLDEVGSRENVQTHAVEMSRSITPVADLRALWKLYRLFRREKPEIVHTHTPKAGLLGMMAAKMAGVPIRLHTVAGMPLMVATGKKRALLEFTEKMTYSCATRVYPNSKELSAFILDHRFCEASKVKVLGNGSSNGIDTSFYTLTEEIERESDKIRAKYSIKPEDFVFLFIGRIVRDKGIEELVAAFSKLKLRHRNIKLLLVGPYEEKLDPISYKTLTTIREDEDIIEAGFQSDVRPYLQASHALTFPSYREGFPNVPMQAGCFHLPSVVTDINGCNEIVEEGKNGLIIPVKNANALYEAMDKMITDKALYEKMKSNARPMIVDRYEQQYFWSLLLNEYKTQLNQVQRVS